MLSSLYNAHKQTMKTLTINSTRQIELMDSGDTRTSLHARSQLCSVCRDTKLNSAYVDTLLMIEELLLRFSDKNFYKGFLYFPFPADLQPTQIKSFILRATTHGIMAYPELSSLQPTKIDLTGTPTFSTAQGYHTQLGRYTRRNSSDRIQSLMTPKSEEDLQILWLKCIHKVVVINLI